MSMEHNFMGSIDKANWPTYTDGQGNTQFGKNSSSIMEYSQTADDVFWNNGTVTNGSPTTGWLPVRPGRDRLDVRQRAERAERRPEAAGYAGRRSADSERPGQTSATAPWNDPLGWTGSTEKQFLFCSHEHIRYTPLCRQFDLGSTPAEITAADIEAYEWNYNWRNFRQYYKVWDASSYATNVTNIDHRHAPLHGDAVRGTGARPSSRRSSSRVGIVPPAGAANAGNFYTELTNQFNADVGSAQELVAAFHEAIIQQSTGQRPFQTTYDPYFGDVVQQGISVDKEVSFINWLGLWPYDNYDPTQSAGYWDSSMVRGPGDQQPSQAWSTVGSMLGEKGAWDAYPEFFPSAVALFGHDTQSSLFTVLPYPAMRDWIGGHTFVREQDAIDYFRNLAVQNPRSGMFGTDPYATDPAHNEGCDSFATCTYNPMIPAASAADIGHSNATTNVFIGPEGRRWVWMYLSDRNEWFFCDQDRNSSSFFQVQTYNQDVLVNYDDGNIGPVYNDQAKVKYMIDSYNTFGGDTGATN